MSTRLHRSEVDRQIGRLRRACNIHITKEHIEAGLGYPLVEAGIEDLCGVIATLEAVFAAAYTPPAAQFAADLPGSQT